MFTLYRGIDSAVLITKQHFLGGVEVKKDKENDIYFSLKRLIYTFEFVV